MTDEKPAPTTDQYEAALRRLPSVTDAQLRMLRIHYRAPNRTISATALAEEALGHGHYASANSQYGRLGRMVGDLLDYNPMKERLGTLVTFQKRNDEWHWVLRPEVAAALERLGWLTAPPGLPADPGDAGSFTHAEFFPALARLIIQDARRQPGTFVSHETMVDLVLADDAAAAMVRSARTQSSWPNDRAAASNMVAWFSQQITIGRSEWKYLFERERVGNAWAYRPVAEAMATAVSDADIAAIEGEPRLFFHLRRERDPGLIREKRNAVLSVHGCLRCEVCDFVAEEAYSGWPHGSVCEVHHRVALADGEGSVVTRLEDLAVLCPTCHRAIHRTKPLMTVEDFRTRYRSAV